MGLAEQFSDKKIYIDTAPFIYYIEGNKKYQPFLEELFELNNSGKISFSTSVLTLLELLIVPLRNKRMDLVEKYESIFTNSDTLELLDIDLNISKLAAEYRANYNFKTPDAIQLAAAEFCQADFFLTNDKQLKQSSIKTVVLDDALNNTL